MTKGAPGAERGAGDINHNVHSAPADDVDSSDDSLRERVLKVVADRESGPLRHSRKVRRA